jgi:hypothetical protein
MSRLTILNDENTISGRCFKGSKRIIMNKILCVLSFGICSGLVVKSNGQDADRNFPRYTGNREINTGLLDGGIPWAIGVHSYGVFRAFNNEGKTHDKDGLGYQFNHHPNLVYWKNYYWISYQGGPTDGSQGEKPPVPYLITYSADGRTWEAPETLFPSIQFKGDFTYMHSRMGFHVSTSGKLLAISFHGRHKSPNGGGDNGVARVVREIYKVNKDGRISLGPIYAIRYNEGRTFEDTSLAYYTSSADQAFVAACNELVNDKLVTQQWFEEDRREALYTANLKTPNDGPDASDKNVECKAFNWYTLPSGRIIGWWKGGAMAYSDDGWKTTSKINIDFKRLEEHRTAKMWGQKLSNDKYALIYCLNTQPPNPATEWSTVRSPLVVSKSDDGLLYPYDRAVVFGDIAPSRYINPPFAGGLNDNRDGGAQYVRGISESNTGKPNSKEPTGNLWVTYSVNKEDIWVSEVPVNIRHTTDEYIKDDFQLYHSKNLFGDWIIQSPSWAPVSLAKEKRNAFMRLYDKDPYDYAKAMRVFPASDRVIIQFRLRTSQLKSGLVNIDITDKHGKVAARLQWDKTATISAVNETTLQRISNFTANEWVRIQLRLDCKSQEYELQVGDKKISDKFKFYDTVEKLERFEIRTGKYRLNDFSRIGTWKAYPDSTFPDADKPVPMAIVDLDDLIIDKF